MYEIFISVLLCFRKADKTDVEALRKEVRLGGNPSMPKMKKDRVALVKQQVDPM